MRHLKAQCKAQSRPVYGYDDADARGPATSRSSTYKTGALSAVESPDVRADRETAERRRDPGQGQRHVDSNEHQEDLP